MTPAATANRRATGPGGPSAEVDHWAEKYMPLESATRTPETMRRAIAAQLTPRDVIRTMLAKLVKDHLRGVVDMACVISAMGDPSLEAHPQVAQELGVDDLIEREEGSETLRFGDGGAPQAREARRFHPAIAGMLVIARACVVKSGKLLLLFGRDRLAAVGAGIGVARGKLGMGPGSQSLLDTRGSGISREN